MERSFTDMEAKYKTNSGLKDPFLMEVQYISSQVSKIPSI